MKEPITTGFAAGRAGQSIKGDGGVPQIRPTNIIPNYGISYEKAIYIPCESIGLKDCIVDGEVLFNNTNSSTWVGKSSVYRSGAFERVVCSNHISRLRPKNEYSSEFLSAVLNMMQRAGFFKHVATNFNNQAGINAKVLAQVELPVGNKNTRLKLTRSLNAARSQRLSMLKEADDFLAGIDQFILDQLGIILPETDGRMIYGVRLGETLSSQRIDPHRFSPRTKKLRQMVSQGKYATRPLDSLIQKPVSGDWGDEIEDHVHDLGYVEALVIRATEFDDRENLVLENSRVRHRSIKESSFHTRSLLPTDILLEKSGGGPHQPVGRVAMIQPEHLEGRNITFTNFVARLRISSKIEPAYLWAFLGLVNRCGLTESMQAQTHGIRNLKMDEYLVQPVPVPSSKIQSKIALEVAARRSRAQELRMQADAIWEQAKDDFETALLGVEDSEKTA